MTQPTAPPQYSPDGRWWWDGAQWVPVPMPPPPTVWATQPDDPFLTSIPGDPTGHVDWTTVTAIVCGLFAVGFPYVLGPAGIGLSVVARRRGQQYAPVSLGLSVLGLLVGLFAKHWTG